MTAGYKEFEFDLPGALLKNLVAILDSISPITLTLPAAASIPDEQGIYQLFLDDTPVYVGKTDADAGLQKRLVRHSRKIQHRVSLDPIRVTFKAVRVYVFTAVDMESDLIRHYGGVTGLAWNGSGFGSNDPGRNRDDTKNKATNYDFMFPIDIDRPLPGSLVGGPAASVLSMLRAQLPYTLRFDRKLTRSGMASTTVEELLAPFTAREAICHVVAALPCGWQATKLLGYIILYEENRSYPDAQLIARS